MARPTGLAEGSVVDDDTQTVVGVPRFHEDTSINALLEPQEDDEDTHGTPYMVTERSEIELFTTDMAGASQLQTWMESATQVQAVAVGLQQILQWYQEDELQAHPSEEAEVGPAETERILLQSQDALDSHQVYWSRNALFHLFWNNEAGFVDLNNDGIPDGFLYTTGSGPTSEDVTSAIYEVTNDAAFGRGGVVLMPLPTAQTWTLSVEWTSLHSDATNYIELEVLDKSGTAINSTLTSVQSTGRASATVTASTDAYELRATVLGLDAVGSSGTARVKEPALRVGTATSYVTR